MLINESLPPSLKACFQKKNEAHSNNIQIYKRKRIPNDKFGAVFERSFTQTSTSTNMRFLYLFIQNAAAAEPADSIKNFDLEGTIYNILHTPVDILAKKTGSWFLDFAFKVIACLLIFWISKKIINYFSTVLRKLMDRRRVDPTVSHFLINLLRVIFWLIVVWMLISVLEINTASIVAMFASAGLAFGLALSGTLQNFAGGVMILLFKPFRVGDYISSQGEEGTVSDITIINTVLTTPDNRTIYLPNGATFTGIVRNTSDQKTRRIEWTFSIGYGDSYDRAKKLLFELISKDSRIMPQPEPFVALSNLGESSVNIVVRVWVKSADFWGVFYDLNEKVYKAFPAADLSIPFPQMDVYLHQPDAEEAPQQSQEPPKTVSQISAEVHHSCDNQTNCDDSAKPSGGESGK